MKISAEDLCKLLDGQLEGDPHVSVSRPSKIEEGEPGTISFLANPKYEAFAYSTNSSILLVDSEFKPKQPISATLIRVEDVYKSVSFLLEYFQKKSQPSFENTSNTPIHPEAIIGESVQIGAATIIEKGAKIGEGSLIYPQVYIGKNVQIGKNTTIYPGVKIYHDCKIGDQCIIHANVVIGSDGFGFAPQEDGTWKKIPQIGNVVIENEVEIGANTVIDRATMGSTYIRKGVKLDNLIQVAHNVEIGAYTAVAAQAGIAGSTTVGENCLIGGQVGLVGHIQIADKVKIQAQSGVASSIKKEGQAVYGSPAFNYSDYLKSYVVFRQLPQLNKELERLKKEIQQLKAKTEPK